ncbi:MAG TPA: glycerophosphodiester phosphodiesterase [Vicinamibacterales bacterium]|nr:glycerophosphodiester phosphodiesterase [Vicinamibacterales bacterium]
MRLLSPSDPVVIAHRGGGKLRPENTIAAFDHAVALGVDGCECDVRLSRDGEVVVIHDPTLDRTTEAAGPVSARTAAELAATDAGARFDAEHGSPFRGRGFGVPRLADLLARYPTVDWVVEIKGDRPEVAEAAIEVIRRAGAASRVIVGGFDAGVMQAVRRLAPELPTSAAQAEARSAIRRARFRLRPRPTGFRLFQVPIRFDGRDAFNRAFVRLAHRAGFPVHAWIVDDAEEMRRLLDWGVTGLISDRPDIALEVLGRRTL